MGGMGGKSLYVLTCDGPMLFGAPSGGRTQQTFAAAHTVAGVDLQTLVAGPLTGERGRRRRPLLAVRIAAGRCDAAAWIHNVRRGRPSRWSRWNGERWPWRRVPHRLNHWVNAGRTWNAIVCLVASVCMRERGGQFKKKIELTKKNSVRRRSN